MVRSLHYTLDNTQRVNWTATQEKSLANDYPFELEKETDEQYVARTYLQFLWFPESITPLKLFIPCLLRVESGISSCEPRPLHALLKPLLQTARSSSNKYHVELPKILSNCGGAGEIEEMTMWYALNYERADDELWTRTSAIGQGPWMDEKWRTGWIERMERREFQIQILLYFLKLSLPGPLPLLESPQKRSKGSQTDPYPTAPLPSDQSRLEAFMDKLSMWQLMSGLELISTKSNSISNSKEDERDWMQVFCEEIVEPQFKPKLPEICALLRSKIFPNSPSTSSRSPSRSSSRATSPDASMPFKSSKSSTRQPSPALSAVSSGTSSKVRPLERSRSRSLSVSLAQERERERERSVVGATKKRVLNREISMSRVFKSKPKVAEPKITSKRKRPQDDNPASARQRVKDEGVTLVDDTPVKPKAAERIRSASQSQPIYGSQSSAGPFGNASLLKGPVRGDDDDDDQWRLPSSPDILLLGGQDDGRESRGLGLSDDEDDTWGVSDTPSKSKRPRVR